MSDFTWKDYLVMTVIFHLAIGAAMLIATATTYIPKMNEMLKTYLVIMTALPISFLTMWIVRLLIKWASK